LDAGRGVFAAGKFAANEENTHSDEEDGGCEVDARLWNHADFAGGSEPCVADEGASRVTVEADLGELV